MGYIVGVIKASEKTVRRNGDYEYRDGDFIDTDKIPPGDYRVRQYGDWIMLLHVDFERNLTLSTPPYAYQGLVFVNSFHWRHAPVDYGVDDFGASGF
jgi:hypothetical protein